MIPESSLIKSETIIRELNSSDEVFMTKKSTLRWLALSLGLISPNETRKFLFEVFETLIDFHIQKNPPTTRDIVLKLDPDGSKHLEKSIYYHLLRLKNAGIINRKKSKYYFGDGDEKPLKYLFRVIYTRKLENAFSIIDSAFDRIEKKGEIL